jgi:hypothetical protein
VGVGRSCRHSCGQMPALVTSSSPATATLQTSLDPSRMYFPPPDMIGSFSGYVALTQLTVIFSVAQAPLNLGFDAGLPRRSHEADLDRYLRASNLIGFAHLGADANTQWHCSSKNESTAIGAWSRIELGPYPTRSKLPGSDNCVCQVLCRSDACEPDRRLAGVRL